MRVLRHNWASSGTCSTWSSHSRTSSAARTSNSYDSIKTQDEEPQLVNLQVSLAWGLSKHNTALWNYRQLLNTNSMWYSLLVVLANCIITGRTWTPSVQATVPTIRKKERYNGPKHRKPRGHRVLHQEGWRGTQSVQHTGQPTATTCPHFSIRPLPHSWVIPQEERSHCMVGKMSQWSCIQGKMDLWKNNYPN